MTRKSEIKMIKKNIIRLTNELKNPTSMCGVERTINLNRRIWLQWYKERLEELTNDCY